MIDPSIPPDQVQPGPPAATAPGSPLAAGAAVPFFIAWAVVTTSGWSAPAGRLSLLSLRPDAARGRWSGRNATISALA
jgi:hypothetical protein